MHWWMDGVEDLNRLESALGRAGAALRRPAAWTWSGPAAIRFVAALEEELHALRQTEMQLPAVRRELLRHVRAAEAALHEVRHGG